MKQGVIFLLRKLHLLSLAESLRSLIQLLQAYPRIRLFSKVNPDFILPPWDIAYDAYAGLDPDLYLDLGQFHANKISRFIKIFQKNKKSMVCDWGCGPMRVLRHLPRILGPTYSFVGLDYNKKTIQWAQTCFPKINFKLNDLHPPLPLKNDSLDILYCISVFTHLSEDLFRAYVKDIHRALKKEGLLIVTLHGDRNTNVLLKSELKQYKKGKFVVRGGVKEGKRIFASYHPKHFVLDAFKDFTLLKHDAKTERIEFQQDWWIFRK
jgi:SAM-dependent methyltransferase